MRLLFIQRVLLAALVLGPCCALAQMHKVAKPEQVVRAVGVYEWTGDFAKPAASRLIPVSLYIEGKFEDAGIYIARPIPFALLTGNVYELQSAGVDKGYLDLVYARHLVATSATGDLAWDDGWFGYGKVQPLATPKRTAALKPTKNLPVLQSSVKDTARSGSAADPDRPTMQRRGAGSSGSGGSTASTTASTPADDPDRPTMKRRDSSGTTSGDTASTASGAPADDPDRPVMKRRDGADGTASSTPDAAGTASGGTASSGTASGGTASGGGKPADDPDRPTMTRRSPDSSGTSTASTGSGSDPANDPDRPTLKRHTPEEARKARNANDSASTTGYNSLNNDPDRPNLHYGKPTHALTETDLPKLTGLPVSLHQMVAVSDAATRDPHGFTREWDDAAEHAAVLAKMQAMAQTKLAGYKSAAASTAAAAAAKKSVSASNTAAKTVPKTHHAVKPVAPAAIAVMDEELKAYVLSYGGAATYVYSAHTAGTGAALRYVTIVAQDNGLGDLKAAIESVTDAAHLDDTPRMRLVDAVDAEASNRASLLFELRGQNSRQFGLYRVIAGHSDQIFLTGTTQ